MEPPSRILAQVVTIVLQDRQGMPASEKRGFEPFGVGIQGVSGHIVTSPRKPIEDTFHQSLRGGAHILAVTNERGVDVARISQMTLGAAYNEVTIPPMNTGENEPQAAEIRRMQ